MQHSEDDCFHLTEIEESSDDDLSDIEAEEEDLVEEREAVQKKLNDFEEISQKLLAELSMLEAEYEIEKTCREKAEVFASQMNTENKKLKRFSMKLMPILCEIPEEIQHLVSEEPQVTETDTDDDSDYQQQIKDLQEIINNLREEKKDLALELEEERIHIKRLNKEIEEENLERKCLVTALVKKQKELKKVKRVSMMVTQEFNETLDDLEREQELRQHAEIFAHQMLKDNQVANRQSMILMQSVEPNSMLMKALDEVNVLTLSLEETKDELQAKITNLESLLAKRPSEEDFELIQKELTATKEEKRQLGDELNKAEDKCKQLEQKVNELEEKLKETEAIFCQQTKTVVSPSPPTPPPPPPVPPPPAVTSKSSENYITLIQQRKGIKKSDCNNEKKCNDVSTEAVKEMMERIKNGIVLRPARKDGQRHSSVACKRKSVINELQGLLVDTVKKPTRKISYRRISRKINVNELDGVLSRRRRIVDISIQSDVGSEKSKEKQDNGSLKTTVVQGAIESSPVFVANMRQKTSDLQQSSRKVTETNIMSWQ